VARSPNAIARNSPNPVPLFCTLLLIWLFHLRDRLRAGRFDGYYATGSRAVGNAHHPFAGGWVLSSVSSYQEPKLAIRLLGFDFSILRVNNDVGSHRFANATVLADRIGAIVGTWHYRRTALARSADLPRGNVDVW